MDLSQLIDALSRPAAYPFPVDSVEVHQTHISAVFLVGEFVYKVKKPVAPGFLDFTTLEKRRYFCEEEVRLNRRLAPDVYLGVVPIVAAVDGVRVEAEDEAVEWAVKMCRLPEEATLLNLLERGDVDAGLIESLARRVAAFHRRAEANDHIASFGRFEAVAKNIVDVLDRAAPNAPPTVFARVRDLMQQSLARLRRLIESRAAHGMIRDGHGDLHLDHVYVFPGRPQPGDLVIIDCIEFSEELRCLDPIADMAFIVMDLEFQGRRDLARTFAETYFLTSGDDEGRALLPLYTAYRAAVRGMVEGMLVGEPEVPEADRSAAIVASRAHWLLALGGLESRSLRPCLLLVGGMPGTGKSTVSAFLAEAAGFEIIRSDVVRKEMAGIAANEPTPLQLRESLYSPDASDRIYAECLGRAEQHLAEGGRVLVDATFREDRHRVQFLDAAVRFGVPVAMIGCEAYEATIRNRLDQRRGDASDADWAVFAKLAWEPESPAVKRVTRTLSTDGEPLEVGERALNLLREIELHD